MLNSSVVLLFQPSHLGGKSNGLTTLSCLAYLHPLGWHTASALPFVVLVPRKGCCSPLHGQGEAPSRVWGRLESPLLLGIPHSV